MTSRDDVMITMATMTLRRSSLLTFVNLCAIRYTVWSKEYCQFESFNASCSAGHVILMSEAKYGRLHLGRCVTRDYGHVGCSADVIDILDRACSGQRWCQFQIPTLRDAVQPCPRDLTAYLDASYTCVSAYRSNHLRCNDTTQVDSAMPTAHISFSASSFDDVTSSSFSSSPSSSSSSSSHVTESVPFSPSCPIRLKSSPGQRINLTFLSLGHHLHDLDPVPDPNPDLRWSPQRICPIRAFVTEQGHRTAATVLCQTGQREMHVLVTNSSSATLFFARQQRQTAHQTTNQVHEHRTTFILKIEAVGCPDVAAPAFATVERTDQRAILRCNGSMETWYLTCKDRNWIGSSTNCSHVALPVNDGKLVAVGKTLPLGLMVAIAVGIVLGILFGAALLSMAFVYRQRTRSDLRRDLRLFFRDVIARPGNENLYNHRHRRPTEEKQERHLAGTTEIYSQTTDVCPIHSSSRSPPSVGGYAKVTDAAPRLYGTVPPPPPPPPPAPVSPAFHSPEVSPAYQRHLANARPRDSVSLSLPCDVCLYSVGKLCRHGLAPSGGGKAGNQCNRKLESEARTGEDGAGRTVGENER